MDATSFQAIEARPEHYDVLARLFVLYQYDFTEFTDEDVADDGTFPAGHLSSYFEGDRQRHAFLLRADGRSAGFVLLRHGDGVLRGDVTDIAEFFVMRKYRRRGAGEWLARFVFDRYPGRWEVRQLANNLPAQAFWRKIVGRYTDGRYEEHSYEDGGESRPLQTFDNSTR